jgi:hypothetical protein
LTPTSPAGRHPPPNRPAAMSGLAPHSDPSPTTGEGCARAWKPHRRSRAGAGDGRCGLRIERCGAAAEADREGQGGRASRYGAVRQLDQPGCARGLLRGGGGGAGACRGSQPSRSDRVHRDDACGRGGRDRPGGGHAGGRWPDRREGRLCHTRNAGRAGPLRPHGGDGVIRGRPVPGGRPGRPANHPCGRNAGDPPSPERPRHRARPGSPAGAPWMPATTPDGCAFSIR